MVNAAGYLLREKKIPNSALLFTGVLRVPPDCKSGTFHQRIVDTFDGRKENIKRLDDQKEMDKNWETIEEALSNKVIKRAQMPQLCLDKFPNREACTLEEVKLLVQKGERPPKAQDQKQDGPPETSKSKAQDKKQDGQPETSKPKSVSRTVNAVPPAKDPSHNVPVASETSPTSDVTEEVSTEGANGFFLDEIQSQKQELFWAFIDNKGRIGEQYFFDQEVQSKMIEILKKDPESQPAQFYIQSGILINPILQNENLLLRNRVGELERDLRESQDSLQEVTIDRNERARDALDAGSQKVGELHSLNIQKEAAELTVKALQQQVKTLEELLDQKKKNDEVVEKLDALSITTNGLKDDIGKIKQSAERSISFIGSERERRDRYLTPAAEMITEAGAKIVLIGREFLFKLINSYKPLARDMDKLLKNKMLIKIVIEGNGLDMANDFLKKKLTQEWGDGALVVLVIDGAEGGVSDSREQKKNEQAGNILSDSQKKTLASTAGILSLAVEADSAKAVLLVAGPCSQVEVVAARKEIFLKMEKEKVTTILKMAKDKEEEVGEAEQGGDWSALTAAKLVSTIAWWADSGHKKEPNERESPEKCSDCGFTHGEADHCFKEEVPAAIEEKSEEKNLIKINPSTSSNKRPPNCFACGHDHYGNCRGRIRWCKPCNTNHAGICRPETQNYSNRDNGPKKAKY